MQNWLLIRGTRDRLLPQRVDPQSLRAHSSTRRPSLQKKDLALCYASGWQTIFAVVEIVGDPENDPSRERWQWRVPIHPLLVARDLSRTPPVEVAGVFPRSLGRHSYVRLTEEQFRAGFDALAAAAPSALI
jgi:hypothetical protein